MKDIQQLIKKNSQEGRYEDIFPKTFIDAVEDRESGNSLTEILSGFNMYFLSYNGSREYTRLQVPLSLRKTGLWITYVLYDKTVVTEWYAGEAIDDDSWKSPDNWRVGTNTLVGDISISSDGYWVINGVVTATKAQGEQGITPMLRVGNNNHLQVSYTNGSSWIDVSTNPVYTQFRVLNNKLQQSTDLGNTYTYISEELAYKFRESGNKLQMSKDLGNTWEDVSTNPVYTQFRINNNKLEQSVDLGDTWIVVSDELAYQFRNSGNKLQVSKDLGVTWEDTSDYIAAWFKFTGTTGSSQAGNVGKIQISRDNGVTWSDLSGEFTNSLHIKGYVTTIATLPSSAVQGDIYGVGPTYDPSDTGQTNPIYQLYVKDSTGWVNNGKFTSIAAGVVQTTGTSTTEVMSQDAVSKELASLETDLNTMSVEIGSKSLFELGSVDGANGNLVDNVKRCRVRAYVSSGLNTINAVNTFSLAVSTVCAYNGSTFVRTITSSITRNGDIINFNCDSTYDNVIIVFYKSNGTDFTNDEIKIYYLYSDTSRIDNLANLIKNTKAGINLDLSEIEQEQIQGGVYDVSSHNDGAVFESLPALLGSANLSTLIPTSVRHGGMSIRFIQGSVPNSDNKYVQYRLMSNSFNTTTANWQGVDDKPTAGSDNLVKSGGVYGITQKINQLSVNLINPQAFTLGKGLYPNGSMADNTDLNLSDFIPVNGQNIVCNGYSSTYWRAGVYDKNFKWLRAITSNYYTYQEGDFYIRINFLASNTQPIANYGIILIPYEPYMPIEGYMPKSSVIKAISNNIENINKFNANAPLNFVFESGTFSADMTESDDDTRVRSSIIQVGHGRKVYVNLPSGFQYIIYASNDGVTYAQQNLWTTPKILIASNQEKGYAFVRILIKKSNNKVILPYEFIDFNISLDGNIVDDIILQDSLLVEKDKGNFMSTNVASQEIQGSSVTGSDKSYITPYINAKSRHYPKTRRIVAVNHDDLTKIDYRGTRQIYNKYDFHSNFNFILYPFATVAERDEAVKFVKKMIEEGHSIGLHAYFSSAAWIINKLFDVRPDGTATFAPNVTELKPVAGGSLNTFNQTVTATTKFRGLNYVNPPQAVADINVVDSTQSDVNTLTQHYCVFTQNESITGVDLDGNIVTKGRLEWAEYWYNNLVSNVGYSTQGSVSERFAADYAIPIGGNISNYYPDAEHLLNGKIVKYDDTNNPHYADSDYQKVGYFTKGLFIGCSSTCNSEVIERIIHLSTMVARYYFGIDHFDYFNRHGVQYAEIYWSQNGYPFDNREKTVLHHERGYWYNTYSNTFTTAYDSFKAHGIRMSGHSNIMPAKFGVELGLYFGQNGKRSDDFNEILNNVDGLISFTNLLGTDGDTMNYSTFINYFGSKSNWIKYAYENAGKTVIGANSSTINMTTHLKDAIDVIRSLEGTNKIPFFSFDTIKDNYSAQVGVDLLCRYCYMNNIEIVTPEVARKIAIGLGVEYKHNYYPNPKFKQSLIDQFGYFDSKDAYTPDGMRFVQKVNNNNEYNISVNDVSISDVSQKVLSQTNVVSRVRIFGLPSGDYRFSIKGKGRGTIFILLNKNSDLAASVTDLYSRAAHYISINTQLWTDYNYEFTVNEPYLGNINRESAASMLSCGGQDNIINFEIIYYGNASETLYLANPKIGVN